MREALRAGLELRSLHLHRGESAATQALVALARERGVRLVEASRRELDSLAKTPNHQGVVAVVVGPAVDDEHSVESILLRAARLDEPPLVLVLDGIQDPHNLGALVRSAWALGAHGVIIPDRRAAPITPTVIKASAGAAAHLPIARLTNIKHAIDALKEAGVWCAAAMLDGDPVETARLDGPLALVIGGESKGVRPTVGAHCDLRIRIGLARDFDSLNASVAGGILLYEAVRQRRAVASPPQGEASPRKTKAG